MAEQKIDIQIPGHRILRELGRGGMANVYLATQESMERDVALKIMLPALAASDPSFSERFVREAKIIAKLSHPHINAVYDVGVAGVYNWFTMEYITGGDLKSRIHQGMAPKAALAIVRQIASALAFAHSKGYVHRDVKPENVLFRDSGTAVLTDFGIAKTNDAAHNMTATGAIVGTPYYMSPEQAMGRKTDKRSDIYSLGVLLYEMLTGHVPYSGDSAISIGIKHLKDPIPHLSPPLRAYQPLLEKALAKEVAQRFQSGEDVVAAIDALASGAAATTTSRPVGIERTIVLGPGATTAQTGAGAGRTKRGALIAAAVLIPLLAGAAYFAWRKPAPIGPPLATAPTPVAVEPPAMSPTETPVRSTQIPQLLADADSAARAGQYFEPLDTAAVPKYRRVLELESGNPRATRALNEIAGQFIAQAERAIEKNNLDQAETLLKQAEDADATHPMLFSRRLALSEYRKKQAALAAPPARTEPKTAVAAKPTRPAAPAVEAPKPAVASAEDARAREIREREQKLQGLLSRFQELVAPGALSAMRAGLAQDVVGEATQLAPNDGRVRTLPGQLADAYLKLATTKAEEKEYQEADALVRRGLDLKPDHRQLLALQKDLAEKQKQKRPTFGSF